MKYLKKVIINVGDVVNCLTADGWVVGTVTKINKDKVTVFMDYISEEAEFEIDFIFGANRG